MGSTNKMLGETENRAEAITEAAWKEGLLWFSGFNRPLSQTPPATRGGGEKTAKPQIHFMTGHAGFSAQQ